MAPNPGRSLTLFWSDTLEVSVGAVVGDVRDDGFDADLEPLFYLPWAASPTRYVHAMIRVRGDPAPVMASIRSAVGRVDPDLPVGDLRPSRRS